MQAYSVRVYGGACIVCCLGTVVRNVYGMFNNPTAIVATACCYAPRSRRLTDRGQSAVAYSTAEGETLFLDGDSITHLFFMSDRFDGDGDVTSASPFS